MHSSRKRISGFISNSFMPFCFCLIMGMLALPALAQVPTPNTFTDWPVPQLTEWNNVNTRTVIDTNGAIGLPNRHSYFGNLEGEAPSDVTFIYPDQATRDADIDGLGVGSVAFISWGPG